MPNATMLGSNGFSSKAPAPSIWSFDSGYESYDVCDAVEAQAAELIASEDPSEAIAGASTVTDSIQQHRTNSPFFGNFFNVRVGNQVRLQQDQPTINPVLTRLNVSSRSSSRTNSILIDQPVEDNTCLSCELWNTISPGEPNQCDTCNPPKPSSPAGGIKHVKAEATKLDTPKSERCSACELSALINPKAKCPTCTEAESKVAPPKLKVEVPSHVRRSRAGRSFKLPPQALDKLQGWLEDHSDNPYPSSEDKKRLAQECGITEKQVTTWFTNARARRLNPMESYSSCSEDEAAPDSAVFSAADSTPFSAGLSPAIAQGAFQGGRSRAGSVSASSIASPLSPQARRQGNSRRGKKKIYRRMQPPQLPTIASMPPNNDNQTGQDTWQCTFCLKHLSPKSWRRHEETQHLPRVSWTCMLFGPRLSYNHRQGSCCAFCMEENPTEDHFLTHHRISECAARPSQDRTFYRPDHLRQHVKNYHGATLHDLPTTKWKREARPIVGDWKCGFCGVELEAWDARETHIANHFRDGKTMAEWRTPLAVEPTHDHDHNETGRRESVQQPRTPATGMSLSPYQPAMTGGSISSNTTSPMERQSPFAQQPVPSLLYAGQHSRDSSNGSMLERHSPFTQRSPFQPPIQNYQPTSMPQMSQAMSYAQQPGMLPALNFPSESLFQSCGNFIDQSNAHTPDPLFTTADSLASMEAMEWTTMQDFQAFGNTFDGSTDYEQYMNDGGNRWGGNGN